MASWLVINSTLKDEHSRILMTLFNKVGRDLDGSTTWLFIRRLLPIAVVLCFLIVTGIKINFWDYL